MSNEWYLGELCISSEVLRASPSTLVCLLRPVLETIKYLIKAVYSLLVSRQVLGEFYACLFVCLSERRAVNNRWHSHEVIVK